MLRNNQKFLQTFADHGTTWVLSKQIQDDLEEFVCLLYGPRRLKIQKVKDMRHRLYKKKFEVTNEVIDLSLLPPCLDSLTLHSFRSSYVTMRYRLSKQPNITEPIMTNHGWSTDGHIKWVKKVYPAEVEFLIVNEDRVKEADIKYEEEGDCSEESDSEQ